MIDKPFRIQMKLICANSYDDWFAVGNTREAARAEVQEQIKLGKFAKPLYAVVVTGWKRRRNA